MAETELLAVATSNSEAKPDGKPAYAPKQEYTQRLPLRIRPDQVFSLYENSPAFREVIGQGQYTYVDGLFILTPIAQQLLSKGIRPHLYFGRHRKNAEALLANFCLGIEYVYEARPYNPNELHHSAGQLKGKRFAHAERVADIHSISKEAFCGIVGGGQDPPNNFRDSLVFFMDMKGLTEEELEELTGISVRTIRRMRNEEDYQPSLEYVIAICIGMHLRPSESNHMLFTAGYHLRLSPKERAYQYLLDAAYNFSVYECNVFLKRMSFEPLTAL